MDNFTPPENRMPEKVIALQAELTQVCKERDKALKAVETALRLADSIDKRLGVAVEALEEIDDHAHIGGDMWAIGKIARDALRRIEGENE